MIFKPQGLLGYTEMNFAYTWFLIKRFVRRITGKKVKKSEEEQL
jgi:hypothetical protein